MCTKYLLISIGLAAQCLHHQGMLEEGKDQLNDQTQSNQQRENFLEEWLIQVKEASLVATVVPLGALAASEEDTKAILTLPDFSRKRDPLPETAPLPEVSPDHFLRWSQLNGLVKIELLPHHCGLFHLNWLKKYYKILDQLDDMQEGVDKTTLPENLVNHVEDLLHTLIANSCLSRALGMYTDFHAQALDTFNTLDPNDSDPEGFAKKFKDAYLSINEVASCYRVFHNMVNLIEKKPTYASEDSLWRAYCEQLEQLIRKQPFLQVEATYFKSRVVLFQQLMIRLHT